MKKTIATLAAVVPMAAAGAATATAGEYVDITPPSGTENTVTDPVTGNPARVSIGAFPACTQPEDHSQPRHESISLFADRQSDSVGLVGLSAHFGVRDYVIPATSELRLQWTNHSAGEAGDGVVATHGDGSYRLESGPRSVGARHVTFTATVTKTVGVSGSSVFSDLSGIAPSVATSHTGDVILSPCNL